MLSLNNRIVLDNVGKFITKTVKPVIEQRPPLGPQIVTIFHKTSGVVQGYLNTLSYKS